MADAATQQPVLHQATKAAHIWEAHRVLCKLAQGEEVDYSIVSEMALDWLIARLLITRIAATEHHYQITPLGRQAVLGKDRSESLN